MNSGLAKPYNLAGRIAPAYMANLGDIHRRAPSSTRNMLLDNQGVLFHAN